MSSIIEISNELVPLIKSKNWNAVKPILIQLKDVQMTLEILQQSSIGKVVNKIVKKGIPDVQIIAKEIISNWRNIAMKSANEQEERKEKEENNNQKTSQDNSKSLPPPPSSSNSSSNKDNNDKEEKKEVEKEKMTREQRIREEKKRRKLEKRERKLEIQKEREKALRKEKRERTKKIDSTKRKRKEIDTENYIEIDESKEEEIPPEEDMELMPGQKYPTPSPGYHDRLFYESLYQQIPTSEMAQEWCINYGILPYKEAIEVYRKICKRKGVRFSLAQYKKKKVDNENNKIEPPVKKQRIQIIDDTLGNDTGLHTSSVYERVGQTGI